MALDKWLPVVSYCAEECNRQQSGALSVGWMLSAWDYAMKNKDLTDWYDFVQFIGALVEPIKNARGYRNVPVYVGGEEKVKAYLIEQAMRQLLENRKAVTPEEFYFQFQGIHPFVDGNGRTGKILYNLLLGRMTDPVFPPNFWGISNP